MPPGYHSLSTLPLPFHTIGHVPFLANELWDRVGSSRQHLLPDLTSFLPRFPFHYDKSSSASLTIFRRLFEHAPCGSLAKRILWQKTKLIPSFATRRFPSSCSFIENPNKSKFNQQKDQLKFAIGLLAGYYFQKIFWSSAEMQLKEDDLL